MRQWLVDAFASGPFRGNPACVLEPLGDWPTDAWMQALAQENNAGATAFLRRTGEPGQFDLRWFTPATEVPLCGHATLAASHILFTELGASAPALGFATRSGRLTVKPCDRGYEMALPRPELATIPPPDGLAEALGATPTEVWAGPYLVATFDDPDVVTRLTPDLEALKRISLAAGGQGNVGVAARAARGAAYDVVDRFFAPGFGLTEDPATGSLHALLTPIFAPRFPDRPIRFLQAFPGRGADLEGRLGDGQVLLVGAAVTIADQTLRSAPTAGARG